MGEKPRDTERASDTAISRSSLLNMLEDLYNAKVELDQIFDTAGGSMRVLGTDFGHLRISKSFVKLAGTSESEALGKKCHEVFYSSLCGTPGCPVVRLMGGEERVECEIEMERQDGIRVPCILTANPLRRIDAGMVGIVEHFTDFTLHKRAEEEKEKLQAQLLQSQKMESIGTLASGVAHEINNPLNVMLNYGQLLLDDASDPDRVKDFAGNIMKEGERVAVIVRTLLSYARQEKESHSPAQIADIIRSSLSLIGSVLRKAQIEIVCEIPEWLPSIKCRSQQIQQVLMNLLTNARDALIERYPMGSGDKIIRIVASPIEREGAHWVRLSVEDHGDGIPADTAERLFNPFFTTKPRDKGTGLGLSISYEIVADHHGELWFETELGRGTKFHIDLPVDNGWSLSNPSEA